ncbi:MAG TPA: hypothetical protein DCP52_05970, partial [Elusimicrobia bacterium]|nr:hypothetical protein [Elusimicrobiota bacterium]
MTYLFDNDINMMWFSLFFLCKKKNKLVTVGLQRQGWLIRRGTKPIRYACPLAMATSFGRTNP